MVCLSSGESELMALVGESLPGYRNKRPMEQTVQMLTWDDCAVYRQLKRKGASRRTRHVDTKVYFYAGLADGTWTTYLEGTW